MTHMTFIRFQSYTHTEAGPGVGVCQNYTTGELDRIHTDKTLKMCAK